MSSINSYFSPKDNLQAIILRNLESAQHNVFVAVAWLTDIKLFNKLLEIQERGVSVELIITKHQFNDESQNDYNEITAKGGVFIEIGGDQSTMHHKFCIIDHRILLQGSFNWTRKANESNNETLLVIEGDSHSINEFVNEFERLKRIAGLDTERQDLEISKALKYFNLIRTFIDLGKTSEINPYLHEIKDVAELQSAILLLFAGEYEKAIDEMNALEKRFKSIVNVSLLEKEELIFKIRMISEQIKQIEIERTEIETQIDLFNRRYILELNPIIAIIIDLKKKIYEKLKALGIVDETFEELKNEYDRIKNELEREEEKAIPDLSEEQQRSIKSLYHEAAAWCHPDSHNCTIEDKQKAQEIFASLSRAYREKDFEKVHRIHDELKSGIHNPDSLNDTQLERLKIRFADLQHKYERCLNTLRILKTNEPYLTIEKISDWNEYFEVQKTTLRNQKDELELKFVKNEQ